VNIHDFKNCPKCDTLLVNAPGIGPFCPNDQCDVADGILQAAGLAPPVVVSSDLDNVSIPKAELDRLRRAAAKLAALEDAGVDNWEWYGDAMSSLHNGEDC